MSDSTQPARPGFDERVDQRAERVKQATHSAVEHAKEGFAHAADAFEEKAHAGTDAAARASKRAAAQAAAARERGSHAVDAAREKAEGALEQVRDFVRDKPVQSLAIAVAGGWLLGWMLRRRANP